MAEFRPIVMSIAGLDPTAGAGLLADIKCFEQHQVYGFGICSSVTVQTDVKFCSVQWMNAAQIIEQISPLMEKFEVLACKIGLIKDLDVLEDVLKFLRASWPKIKIVVDPILKASAGYGFQDGKSYAHKFFSLLPLIDLVTPNYLEMDGMRGFRDIETAASAWAAYCPVLLKGGHNEMDPGTDHLFIGGTRQRFDPKGTGLSAKHGSGCVLSASITAYLALEYDLPQACRSAKAYIENFLNSNTRLLGYHEN
jgi:hydroxymethylpyrimidine/phosphomethylpyrimidine kinase